MVPRAARLFLGSCMPSKLEVLPGGGGEAAALFNYQLTACKFKRLIKGKYIVYQNNMTYRPAPRSRPAAYTYPIRCVYKRPEGWVPPFLNRGSGSSEGHGDLVFHMGLLDEHFAAVAETNVVPPGSLMLIWAAVEQKSHQPLLLLMDECVAAATPALQPDSLVYPIVSNKGCLSESRRGDSAFLPRSRSSVLSFYLRAFRFPLGNEVFIHCRLVAWDASGLHEGKKACQYVQEAGRWELFDDPSQSAVCSCCGSACSSPPGAAEHEFHSFHHEAVLGPLSLEDPLESRSRRGPQAPEPPAAAGRLPVTMAFLRRVALLVSLAAAVSVHAVVKLDCRPDSVVLVWTESRSQVDTSLLHLGSCYPTSSSVREAVFTVDLSDCNFSRTVTGAVITYASDLSYSSPPGSPVPSFTRPVVCVYDRPNDWYPPLYEPVFETYGRGDLVFHFGLMNGNFSGPAESAGFRLGSLIPIAASVVQKSHQPLLLLLEECVAASTPEFQPEGSVYPIITNEGCLTDGKTSRTTFKTRQKSSELHLLLQAFRFSQGEQVFLRCKLVAWDPVDLDDTKKACHYDQQGGWELLDDPANSHLCDCCESDCRSRKTRSAAPGM
ncbi:zona pellucida sperm-binding protein 3-like [Brachionichthys hirsutus]|uniref:zona pellucida sperm-binding protein 3-like n=1 Tax=Brachionichthys hirsutus TaxID=412623 RepID=UPI00360506BB